MKTTIKLTNFKFYSSMSEETNAFDANIVVNGVKCGYARNLGQGGDTEYRPFNNKQDAKLIEEAEKFCAAMPPEKFTSDNKTYEIKMTLAIYIDNLVQAMVEDLEKAKFTKKIEKLCEKAIVGVREDGEQFVCYKLKLDIKSILKAPGGPEALRSFYQKVVKILPAGFKIANTNLPKQVIA